MNKLLLVVGFTLNLSLLFAQDCNKNVFSEEEAMKLSKYGKELEKRILEKNPADTALIAQLKGDYSKDCAYTDDETIKISNYLRELEKKDSLNNVPPKVEPVVETPKPDPVIETPPAPTAPDYDKTVLFGINSSIVKVAKVDGLVSQMKADPKMHIVLDGYADATASDQFNLALSKRRAKSVKDYLISKGIAASRISTNAHGEKDPAASNDTEEGRAQNRRVTISIK